MAKIGSRRDFFVRLGQIGAGCVVGGTIWGSLLQQSKANPFTLRPPGALPENEFLATCIKCGQCVDACPYQTLSLTRTGDDGELGVPHFVARKVPCYMCPDIPCARVCPTGALKNETKIEESRMGLAVLVDKETCIAFQGLRCEICYRQCPLMGKAITLEFRPQERTGKHAYFEPVVHSNACTGCGLCEHACILDEAAIKVLPHSLAQGKVGQNYRFGWKEKTKINAGYGDSPVEQNQKEFKANSEKLLNNALDSLNNDGTLYD